MLSSSKLWDGVAMLIGLLFSLVVIATLTQLVVGGSVLDTFSNLTLRVINLLFGASIVLMIVILVLENGSPANTMAWIMVLIFLPVIGFFLYLLFGRNWHKRKVFANKMFVDAEILATSSISGGIGKIIGEENYLGKKLNRLLKNNSKAHLTMLNEVKISADTCEAYNWLLEGISNAKQHIHLEYFYITADDTGNKLKNLLIRKAEEGIEIRFIYDDVGCWRLPNRFKRELRNAGVQFVPFMPVLMPFINSRMNYRNHRKLVVIDSKIAFLGGFNIGDRYLGKNPYFGYWRDSMAFISGEAAIALQAIFLLDWLFVNKENLLGQTKYLPSNGSTEFVPDNHIVPIQVAASGPDTEHANILQLYFVAITSARKSIRISSPYLILNESLRMALRTAAISGVKVQIILPCKPDHFMVFWASRSYFKDLMDVGVEIWEYQKGFYHTKLMIVDDAVLLIGTVNMDLRSFNHNFELTATIYQESICRVAIGDFEDDLSNSRRIDLMEFNRRSVINKSKESLCRLVSPLL